MDNQEDQPTIKDVNEDLKAKVSGTEEKAKEGLEVGASNSESAEPHVPEEILVESEVEPPTVATNPQPFAEEVSAPDKSASPSPASAAEKDNPAVKTSGKNTKRIAMVVTAALAAVIAVSAMFLLLSGNDTGHSNQDTSDTKARPRIAVTVTEVEGVVEYVRGEGNWQPIDTSTHLEEGDTIRAFANSHAVLTLEDGTVKEIEAGTVVRIDSLESGNVQIEQIEGM